MSLPTDREIEDMAEELRAERKAKRFCRGSADERGPCGNDDCASCYPSDYLNARGLCDDCEFEGRAEEHAGKEPEDETENDL